MAVSKQTVPVMRRDKSWANFSERARHVGASDILSISFLMLRMA
jgi:hypothetical protein